MWNQKIFILIFLFLINLVVDRVSTVEEADDDESPIDINQIPLNPNVPNDSNNKFY